MKPVWTKFEAIESLRGWMAWWVVLGHALHFIDGGRWLIGYRLSTALGRNNLAVQIFMIISGFVIAHMTVTKTEDYRTYITRRWFRLAPLFIAMLVLAIATRGLYEIAFAGNPWAADPQMRLDRLAAENGSWPAYVVLHLSMLHGLVPDSVLKYSSSAFLAPAWSLSLEWQFYLIAPLLIAGVINVRKSWLPGLAIVASLAALTGHLGTWETQSFLPLALPFFFIGITSRLLLEKRVPWLAIGVTAASALVYAAAHGVRSAFADALIVVPIWALFLLITAREAEILKFRSKAFDRLSWIIALNPLSISLGRVSYSTYLCHIPILAIAIGGGMMFTGATDRASVALFTLAGVILAAASSFVTYRYIEQPGTQWGTHWAKRRPIDDEAAA